MLGVGGLLFRTVQLFFVRDVQTGLVWATKILTDPFHDIKLYHKAPLHLLRGELIDPDELIEEELVERAARLGSAAAPLRRRRVPRSTRRQAMSDHLAQDARA